MDFLFFYEHESREYENLLLLKRILKKRGYSAKISHVSKWGYGWHMLFSAPKVVIVPWLRYDDNVYKYTHFFRKKVNKLANLQLEQIYNEFDILTKLNLIQGLAREGYHICWGENSKNRMISCQISEKHTNICGAVQMDFFHPAFAGYFKSKSQLAEEFQLDESMHWRLFISSFSYANCSQEVLQHLKDNFGDYSEFADISKRSKEMLLNWYEDVLSVKKEIVFIYRPHPSEITDERLLEIERKYNNFKVISAYSIKHWIVACDAIDTWYSTSIAEIYFAKKNCNILRPKQMPDELEVEIMAKAQFINTYTDFIKTFDNNYLNDSEFPIKEEDINRYYSYCNERLSAERLCDYLEKVLTDQSYETDYYSGLVGDKNKYNRMIITSLIGGFIRYFNSRLSSFIPIRKDILRNLEKANIGQRKRMRETEIILNIYIDEYLDNKK